jgi:hypothetical protein
LYNSDADALTRQDAASPRGARTTCRIRPTRAISRMT